MIRLPRLSAELLRRHAPSLAIGIVATILGFAVAAKIGSSSEHQEQLLALQIRADQIEQRLAALQGRPISSVQLCGNADTAQTVLERRFGDAATRTGLTWRDTRFESAAQGPVLLVRIKTITEGPYESIVGVLNELAQGAPTLLIDQARLAQTEQGVRLEIEGTVLCSTTSA